MIGTHLLYTNLLVLSSLASYSTFNPCSPELPLPTIPTPLPVNFPQFERMVILGDSLNDVNNLYTITSGLFPSKKFYCGGRFSNGKVWVEYVHDLLQLKLNKTIEMKNFAVAGAATGNLLGSLYPGITSLTDQVTSQLDTYKRSTHLNDFSKTLFTLWMGGNDYFLKDSTPELVVQELEVVFRQLFLQQKIQHLILGDHPPIARPLQNNTVQSRSFKNILTLKHNQLLREALARVLNQAEIEFKIRPKVTFFETNKFLDPVLTYTLDDELFKKPYIVDKPCFRFVEGKGTVCKDSDKYMFWDSDHPTTKTYRYLAVHIFKSLLNSYL